RLQHRRTLSPKNLQEGRAPGKPGSQGSTPAGSPCRQQTAPMLHVCSILTGAIDAYLCRGNALMSKRQTFLAKHTDPAPSRDEGHPGGAHGRRNDPIASPCLVMRCPPVSPLCASWQWLLHT